MNRISVSFYCIDFLIALAVVAYPFDCITEFMFFETAIEPSDVILISKHYEKAKLECDNIL